MACHEMKFQAHGTVANLLGRGSKRKLDRRFQRRISRMMEKAPRSTAKRIQTDLQTQGANRRLLEMPEQQYHRVATIGNGSHGKVYKSVNLQNGQFVAVKEMRLPMYKQGVPNCTLREVGLLRQLELLEHPNIVKLLEVFFKEVTDQTMCLSLVMEFVDFNLSEFLKNVQPPGLSETQIRDMMLQFLKSLDFLHIHLIIHRDIKPQNILVSSCGQLKIADFGLARIYGLQKLFTTVVMTMWYRAPEVLLGSSYRTSVDLWSTGCIFAELYRRSMVGLPDEDSWSEDYVLPHSSFVERETPPTNDMVPGIKPIAKDLLMKFLTFDPKIRITATDALQHEFFSSHDMNMTTNEVP
uniref:cyclin-dependent kinase 4-like n=1 Tax=Myxine glutinosa TaxID=7769 RepID=UPI00358F5750